MVRHSIAEKGVYGTNQKINTIPAVQTTAARIPPAMMPPLAPPAVELVELGRAEEVASSAGWIPCEGR